MVLDIIKNKLKYSECSKGEDIMKLNHYEKFVLVTIFPKYIIILQVSSALVAARLRKQPAPTTA